MAPLVISLVSFFGVAALVGAAALLLRGTSENKIEDRLAQLTGGKTNNSKTALVRESILSTPLEASQGLFEVFVARFKNLTLLFEQANTSVTPSKFAAISGGLALFGVIMCGAAQLSAALMPVAAIGMGMLPLMWLMFRRKRRLKKFGAQLPDALELISRALRAGHSLAAGFHLVGDEMVAPMGTEFQRVFEEQNLGIPMDEALNSLTERVPNLDLRFFATALILQKQTGGDLAEILDKIGHLIRERFQIWGQVQALTGEGRLSGIVLLALPPALFLAVYKLNPDYISALFTDPMGKQMLAGGVVLQFVGALVIRKIINIKV